MAVIEQIIYTAAHVDGRHGYQVVAKSPGIDDPTLESLEWYTHPAGIDPSSFKGSKSMLLLGGRVAYVMTRNTGIGYDGRRDNIYSHILVLPVDDFGDAGYDSRALDGLYWEDTGARGEIPAIETGLQRPPPPAVTDDVDDVLECSLASLLAGRKVALLSRSGAIQDILGLLPESSRLVPFSTLAPRPARQPEYRFVSVPGAIPSGIPEDFDIIGPILSPTCDIPDDVQYYSQLLRAGDPGAEYIRRIFDDIGHWDAYKALGLACDMYRHDLAGKAAKPSLAKSALFRADLLGQRALQTCIREVGGSLVTDTSRGPWMPVSNPSGLRGRRRRRSLLRDPSGLRGRRRRRSLLRDPSGLRGRRRRRSLVQADWTPILRELSRRADRLDIRFMYDGKPRIVRHFKMKGRDLYGLQIDGEFDVLVPPYRKFDASKISGLEMATGTPAEQPPEQPAV